MPRTTGRKRSVRKMPKCNPGHTVSALHRAFVDESLLHPVELAIRRQTLDCDDVPAGRRPHRCEARGNGLAVEQHLAGAALELAAAVLGNRSGPGPRAALRAEAARPLFRRGASRRSR